MKASGPTNPRFRTRMGNGKSLFLDDRIDRRSLQARRIRELIEDFAQEVGGLRNLPASGQQVVRRLAQASYELELLEAQRASGNGIDPVAFVSLVNSQRRLLNDLRTYRPKAAPKTISDHIARTYGGVAK